MAFDLLYILKALSAIMVVAAHSPAEELRVLEPYTRLFVPFFFMITGFFLSPDRISRYARTALVWFVVLNIIYIFAGFIFDSSEVDAEEWLRRFRSKRFWTELLWFGHAVEPMLWYLSSLFWGLMILKALKYMRKERLIPYIAIAGYVAGVVIGKYAYLLPFEAEWYWPLNGFTLGFPFLAAGMWIKKLRIDDKGYHLGVSASLIGLVIYVAEEYFLRQSGRDPLEGYLSLSAPLVIIPIFYLASRPYRLPRALKAGKWGRRTAHVYYFHVLVLMILASIPGLSFLTRSWLTPLLVFVIIWLISVSVEKLIGGRRL